MTEKALRQAVMERLAMLDRAAEHDDENTLLPLARAELRRLADGWRLLLTVHQPADDGRCRACPGGWRRRRWPCKVWLMAHRHLIGDGGGQRPRRGPLGSLGRGSARGTPPHRMSPTHEPEHPLPVTPAPTTPGGSGAPGPPWPDDAPSPTAPAWPASDQEAAEAASAESTSTSPGQGHVFATPVGGHLETDSTRIHRANVMERQSRLMRRLSPNG
ncbi:hypothetical protein [Actinoalloteichus caeruleus]|uniref:hypothetical protein n=1 Tax=Actinoalloteichus cyanogriseus TaxID=2893586 RepID=UPI000413F5CC